MKGTLLDFNIQLNEGAISGEDGKRYSFFGFEWKEQQAPVRGQQVDFTVNDLGQATSIYVVSFTPQSVQVSSSYSQDPYPQDSQLAAEQNYGFFDWVMKCLKNYVNFSGRARRKEYWYFYLFQILLGFGVGLILAILGTSENTMDVISGLLSLAFFLPSLAVGVRRLHDVNRSGWW